MGSPKVSPGVLFPLSLLGELACPLLLGITLASQLRLHAHWARPAWRQEEFTGCTKPQQNLLLFVINKFKKLTSSQIKYIQGGAGITYKRPQSKVRPLLFPCAWVLSLGQHLLAASWTARRTSACYETT